jgi:hypothetical protein
MSIHNAEIAEIFNEYADLLEVKGANQYRVRTYRTEARNIFNLSHSAATSVSPGTCSGSTAYTVPPFVNVLAATKSSKSSVPGLSSLYRRILRRS